MIIVEFRRDMGGAQNKLVGTIRLPDEGEPILSSAFVEELIGTPIRDRSREDWKLWFHDDPALWIRNCHKAFRTPYLVPVIVKDTHPQ